MTETAASNFKPHTVYSHWNNQTGNECQHAQLLIVATHGQYSYCQGFVNTKTKLIILF